MKQIRTRLPFGQYRGKTIEFVYQRDPGYLRYIVREKIRKNGLNFGELAQRCLDQHELLAKLKEEK